MLAGGCSCGQTTSVPTRRGKPPLAVEGLTAGASLDAAPLARGEGERWGARNLTRRRANRSGQQEPRTGTAGAQKEVIQRGLERHLDAPAPRDSEKADRWRGWPHLPKTTLNRPAPFADVPMGVASQCALGPARGAGIRLRLGWRVAFLLVNHTKQRDQKGQRSNAKSVPRPHAATAISNKSNSETPNAIRNLRPLAVTRANVYRGGDAREPTLNRPAPFADERLLLPPMDGSRPRAMLVPPPRRELCRKIQALAGRA
jgi:hypothetical protein